VKWSVAGRPTFEWGGQDSTGANVIAQRRPNWTHGAIHDLLVSLGNQVVMKGHEHFHARQELDGMVYLTVAKPDDTAEQTGNLWGWRYFCWYPEDLTHFEQNSGFLKIVTDAQSARYSYVQTFPQSGMGNVVDSFTILPGAGTTGTDPMADPARRTWIRDVVPNPARETSSLSFELARGGDVRLAIYDAAGRLVRNLLVAPLPPGEHRADWDGRDASGRRVASGIYFAKLACGDRVDSVKMLRMR
jgi:hypothetical protein